MAVKLRFTVDRPKKGEVKRMAQIITNALIVPPEHQKHLEALFQLLGVENLRAVRAGSEIVGGLGITPMGHFFGGRSVKCAGITLVGVAPQWRGRGAASTLMAETVMEIRSLGYAISSLYASTQELYRKSGYERALVRYVYRLETRDIDVCDRECEMVRVRRGVMKPFKDAYLRRALHANGNLDRHPSLWEWRHNPRTGKAHRYLVKRKGKVEGYVVYLQREKEMSIWITDICALSSAAARRILTFFADHSTMVKKIAWAGGPNDGLLEALGEQKIEIPSNRAAGWQAMMRVVSVPHALRARGYPPGLEAEVHFRVTDDLLRRNDGDFVLKVSGGRGTVRKGGKGRVRLDVRALAQLYAGRYSPRELALGGKLDASEKDMESLAPVFAGPMPWLPDEF
jgi:predicted acetyltransferase